MDFSDVVSDQLPEVPEQDADGNPLTMAWLETFDLSAPTAGIFQDPVDIDDLVGEVRRLRSMGHGVRIHWIYDRPTGSRYERLINKKPVV